MTFFAHREKEAGTRGLPRGVTIRRGTAEDEFATFGVMGRAMGYEMNWPHHAAARHHLRTSPGVSFWVAEDAPRFGGPKIVGYARSVVRDRVWNLTEFFVLPDYHRRGIGSALLARCLADGTQAGVETRFVLASHNVAADALYIRKAGCFPRLPMMLLAGPTENLRVVGAEDEAQILETTNVLDLAFTANGAGREAATAGTLLAEPLCLTSKLQAQLDTLDREIVGFARPPEHAFWAAEMAGPLEPSRLFRRAEDGQIAGYAYIGTHSSGPALARDPTDLPRMIAHVAALARAHSAAANALERMLPTEQYLAIPGSNEVMLRWLLDCGWQIIFQYLLMSSRPFGCLDRYVCHNPLYVL